MKQETMVKIKLPKALPGEEERVFVGLNGKCYSIARGVEVSVPQGVAQILSNAEAAEDEARAFLVSRERK